MIDLMMSPWLTAAQTAPGPCCDSNAASSRRIAATDLACIAAIDSPPGNSAADGWLCIALVSDDHLAAGDPDELGDLCDRMWDLVVEARKAGMTRAEIQRMFSTLLDRS